MLTGRTRAEPGLSARVHDLAGAGAYDRIPFVRHATRRLGLAIGLVPLVSAAPPLAAQSPSKWCAYQLRTPDSIIARHEESVRGSDFVASGNQFPSRMTFRFTGGVRLIGDQRRDFLQKYFVFRGLKGSDTLFQQELEMRGDGSTSYWFPIQATTFEDFKVEVPPGDSMTLFLLWAGAVGPKEKAKDWVFLINEFTSHKSRGFWAEQLATCASR